MSSSTHQSNRNNHSLTPKLTSLLRLLDIQPIWRFLLPFVVRAFPGQPCPSIPLFCTTAPYSPIIPPVFSLNSTPTLLCATSTQRMYSKWEGPFSPTNCPPPHRFSKLSGRLSERVVLLLAEEPISLRGNVVILCYRLKPEKLERRRVFKWVGD